MSGSVYLQENRISAQVMFQTKLGEGRSTMFPDIDTDTMNVDMPDAQDSKSEHRDLFELEESEKKTWKPARNPQRVYTALFN